MNNSKITKAKLDKYFKLTETALKIAKIRNNLKSADKKKCEQFIDFCRRYLSDAKHFRDKGDWVTAFAALNYAHAWLDAAAVAKWIEVKDKDRSKFFTID